MKKILIIAVGVILGVTVLAVACAAIVGTAANNAANPVAAHSARGQTPPPAATPPASTSPPSPATETELPVGAPVGITQNGTDAADIKVTSAHVTTQPADPEFGSHPQNGYYLIVRISARTLNGFTGGFDINPLDFYAKAHGRHFDEDNGNSFDALGMNQNEMDSATLGPGEHTSGLIVFDVSRPHGQVVYAPNLDGQPVASWRY